tara:strand:- start:456 stop:821 length:366 start_codon:yes stop_codon:yes gene_type:complete
MSKLTSYQSGIFAEYLAAVYLWCKGYKLLKWRYKSPFGEIDLLFKKADTLVCVEVKYRHESQDSALCAVSATNRNRVTKTAKSYLSQIPAKNLSHIRFDIITLSWPFSIRHHKNAWYDSGL